jgi:hypothetical protein
MRKSEIYSDYLKSTKLLEKIELDEESAAAIEAKKKGLKYAGFGRWKDNSGKVVAKSQKGKLVPLKTQQASKQQVSKTTTGIKSTGGDRLANRLQKHWGNFTKKYGKDADISDLADYAYTNYSSLTGKKKSERDVEGDFDDNVYGMLNNYAEQRGIKPHTKEYQDIYDRFQDEWTTSAELASNSGRDEEDDF